MLINVAWRTVTVHFTKAEPQDDCTASTYAANFPIRSRGAVYILTFLSPALTCCIREQGPPPQKAANHIPLRCRSWNPPCYSFFPSTKGQIVKPWEVAELFALHWLFFLHFMKMFWSPNPLFWGLLLGRQLRVAASSNQWGGSLY